MTDGGALNVIVSLHLYTFEFFRNKTSKGKVKLAKDQPGLEFWDYIHCKCFRAPFEKVRRPVANLPKAIGPPYESLINLFLWVPIIILWGYIGGDFYSHFKWTLRGSHLLRRVWENQGRLPEGGDLKEGKWDILAKQRLKAKVHSYPGTVRGKVWSKQGRGTAGAKLKARLELWTRGEEVWFPCICITQ